jgi:hypothetical protein
MARNGLQRAGAAILVVLGVGHLAIIVAFDGAKMLHWLDEGFLAAVPLRAGPQPSAGALQNALVFWAGVGSFAIPSILLGALLWGLAQRGITPGAWLGWAVAAWFAVLALLLVPSPAILGVGAGLLLVLAARRSQVTRLNQSVATD